MPDASPVPLSRKTKNRDVGNLGEDAAAAALVRSGYRILDRNHRSPAGELDIIAEHRGKVVFVEVKCRSPRALFSPLEAVDEDKRGRLRKSAKYYLASFRRPSPIRFDVVSVLLDDGDQVISVEVHRDVFQL